MEQFKRGIEYLYRNPVTKEEIKCLFEGIEQGVIGDAIVFSSNGKYIRLTETRAAYDITECAQQQEEAPEELQNSQYKILMWNGKYVDISRLHEGIFISPTPFLMDPDLTMEKYADSTRKVYEQFNADNVVSALSNLKLCELVLVEIRLC